MAQLRQKTRTIVGSGCEQNDVCNNPRRPKFCGFVTCRLASTSRKWLCNLGCLSAFFWTLFSADLDLARLREPPLSSERFACLPATATVRLVRCLLSVAFVPIFGSRVHTSVSLLIVLLASCRPLGRIGVQVGPTWRLQL